MRIDAIEIEEGRLHTAGLPTHPHVFSAGEKFEVVRRRLWGLWRGIQKDGGNAGESGGTRFA